MFPNPAAVRSAGVLTSCRPGLNRFLELDPAAVSVLFTFVYATSAARLRRTEKVPIPVLDILQSVPVPGFLSVTVTASTIEPGAADYL